MNKTFRDLQKQKSSTINIAEEKSELKKAQAASENFLDLSKRENKQTEISAVPKKVLDIPKKNTGEEKFRFVQIDEGKTKHQERLTEFIKLAAAGTLILFVLNIVNIYQRGLTIKNDVIATAFSGYDNLVQAGDQSKQAQFAKAQNSFTASTKNFDDALATLRFLETNQNVFYTKEKTVESVQNLLEAGENISEAGGDFAKGIQHLQNLPSLFLQNNGITQLAKATNPAIDESESNSPPKASLTDQLQSDLSFLQTASDKVDAASLNLANVSDDVLPTEMESKLVSAKDTVTNLQTVLQETQQEIPVVMRMLGARYLHRYLILLQNDAEARPTGGFIGSYLIVDVSDGNIINTEFHDIYETDGQLQENIPAPEDIAKITKTWRMRDSNYSPDFAISAEKAAWFLQKEKGPSVDSVIAINQSFIQQLFDITGPVQVNGLQAPLTKDNYQTVISYLVESKASGNDDPKKILRSFIPVFEKQLIASKNMGGIMKTVLAALNSREIMLYSRNADIESLFDQLGFSGKVIRTQPSDDFLQVITTSIGGNKSDTYMQQDIHHTTLIDTDGTVNDELELTRKDTWTTAELTRWKNILKAFGYTNISNTVQYILGSGPNKSYVKVYVPQGSTLVSTQGIDQSSVETETDNEIQKTYFMFEMDVSAGSKKTVTLAYQLPQKLDIATSATYRFFAQRQPGIVQSTLEKDIVLGQGLKFYDSFPSDLAFPQPNEAIHKTQLVNDDYAAALVGPD